MKLTSYLPAFLLVLLLAASCEKDDPPKLPDTPTPAPEEPIYLPEEGDIYIEAGEDGSLPGLVIGSKYSVDYGNDNQKSTTVNLKKHVFDRNYSTFFASYDRSYTWVGLDLGEKHIITKIGYAPRNTQPGRVQLAITVKGRNAGA